MVTIPVGIYHKANKCDVVFCYLDCLGAWRHRLFNEVPCALGGTGGKGGLHLYRRAHASRSGSSVGEGGAARLAPAAVASAAAAEARGKCAARSAPPSSAVGASRAVMYRKSGVPFGGHAGDAPQIARPWDAASGTSDWCARQR